MAAKKKKSVTATGTATRRRRKAPASDGNAQDESIRLNVPDGELLRLKLGERRQFQREAIRWGYALRNRERWNTQLDAATKVLKDIRDVATEVGVLPSHLEAIAKAGIVEVDIPWTSEDEHWELRIFPWEFTLASLTREFRGPRDLTVVRRLRRTAPTTRRTPRTWLHVISAPGKLADQYDFSSEGSLLGLCVKSVNGQMEVLNDPDRTALEEKLRSLAPEVIHLSGFDSHQGREVGAIPRDVEVEDGYVVRSSDRRAEVLDAEALAKVLTSATRKPSLLCCNIYNSAARIAPLSVAEGAGAAIGFQDSFDDELAERFFATLYRVWAGVNWDLVQAFRLAWLDVKAQGRPLSGSGVVLWSQHSIVDGVAPAAKARADSRQDGRATRTSKPVRIVHDARSVAEGLEVDIGIIPHLNYSLLHNNRPIFDRFRIRRKALDLGRIDDLFVNVQLHVGTDSYPFRLRTSIAESATHVDLTEDIKISLASALSRSVHESIHTSLFAEVTWGEKVVLYRQTHRVTLLPVDEWRFDTKNYQWLPSFVLPRDPAVLKVVDAAQHYLMALRDDATAGFDGYQSVDARPGGTLPSDCAMVDMQVRALWSALLYECPLSYINPPPVFTESSQRLRTPSDCVDGKRGTCIDLALLLASCLEYVEIYPTIFLLKTHAFPAYWRHDSFHEKFKRAMLEAPAAQELEKRPSGTLTGQERSWDLNLGQYREILEEVQAGRLVPLETTLVTGRGSFADAIAEGIQNLASRSEFESMLDIYAARVGDTKGNVTPLPIIRGEP
jgi:hypothetical protein